MREILFRGKRIDNGEWVEGWYEMYPFGRWPLKVSIIPSVIAVAGCYEHKEVDPNTVGQYIGLCDKNVKKIFEGDIVFCKQPINGNQISWHIEKGFVEMKYGAFGLHRGKGYYRPFKDWLEDYEYEVIGNIHDNPELLEEDNG